MKYLFSLLLIVSLSVSAQTSKQNVTQNSAALQFVSANNGGQSSLGSASTFYNPRRAILGSFYLFDNWNNYAVIHTLDKQRFKLNNLNLNVKANSFESKISQDSLFTFNFNNIEKITVNNRVFKNIYSDGGKKVYEVIFESDKFSILKGYNVKLVSGSPNPMNNQKDDKFIVNDRYYIKKGNSIEKFKLSKGKILKLLSTTSGELSEKMESYMSERKYSYKRENDVRNALKHVL